MEKRRDSLSALKLCRFCLTQDGSLTSLYDQSRTQKNAVTLPTKILSCLAHEVFPSDKMPSFICGRCKFFMEMCYDFKQICRSADDTILQYVQNGIALETINWPSSLVKMFRYATRPSSECVQTVVEGGATIEVTSQDASGSDEEDDENTYNIKIEDGSNDESNARTIKVITNDDKKLKDKQVRKGYQNITKLNRHIRTNVAERSYPCKYCNKSFVKPQHYTRHLSVKHQNIEGVPRSPYNQTEIYRCEQCDDKSFNTQDELIYHSAIHATQNLTCPLCQEKFENVDAVTAHIKSHVNGIEFTCDLCELVFTTKEKLNKHISDAHEDEISTNEQDVGMDESSMEVDDEDDDMNIKEEDDHMVVEIKKPDDFILTNIKHEYDEKNVTNSEDSETETFAEASTGNLAIKKKIKPAPMRQIEKPAEIIPRSTVRDSKETDMQTAPILRKAEEVRRKAAASTVDASAKKKEKSTKTASDKSLRLLEKDLQDLKRTNSRDNPKVSTPARVTELLRNKRTQLNTSTPKSRSVEEKKPPLKTPVVEKKLPERRAVTKENKEPKETKEVKNNNTSVSEDKELKDKEATPKSAVKNGTSEKSTPDDGVRRSTRPSKIKDYAKMIRDRSQIDTNNEDDDDSDDMDDEEYMEEEKPESRPKARRGYAKPLPKPAVATSTPDAAPVRKRGRPRKSVNKEVPSKVMKESNEEQEEENNRTIKTELVNTVKKEGGEDISDARNKNTTETEKNELPKKQDAEEKSPRTGDNLLVSPTGQTLKKVPIRALPPGIKPMPLPVSARTMAAGELCEMQIGKKVVKVQKIVMTKAEVEAMAKKGLVEMKDGTMVLKQGIKLPTVDSSPATSKVGRVAEEATKESPIKKGVPTRCDADGDE